MLQVPRGVYNKCCKYIHIIVHWGIFELEKSSDCYETRGRAPQTTMCNIIYPLFERAVERLSAVYYIDKVYIDELLHR